jgi:outer membrane protein assembly factor BamB
MNVIVRVSAIGALAACVWSPSWAQESVNYQLTPAHTGAIEFRDGIELPFRKVWARNLGGPVSFPIIADGKVFVTTANVSSGPYGSTLMALDAATGRQLWRKSIAGSYYKSEASYDDGRVFALNQNGLLRAFNAENGTPLWEKQLPDHYSFNSAPAVKDGRLYIVGAGMGATLYAVDSASGDVIWSQQVFSGLLGPVTLSTDGLFVSAGCHVNQFDSANGVPRWQHDITPCIYNEFANVYYADRVFTRQKATVTSEKVVIHAGLDGSQLGIVPNVILTPAFRGGIGYFPITTGLVARSVSSNAPLWAFNRVGRPALPPIVVNGHVLVVSADGVLFVLNGMSGKRLQTLGLGTDLPPNNGTTPLAGANAGEGMVLVPAGNRLVAFKDASR